MAQAWLGLGQSMMLQKKISQGISYMERAADITPRNSRVWMGLYQAYRLKGDKQKANEAAEQLNKFFQAEEATIEQQQATQKKDVKAEAVIDENAPELPKELQ
jgi:predicted Zn-dependent protease